ncbi:MAG: hypothetical protein WC342_08525 [Methanoregula sp.]
MDPPTSPTVTMPCPGRTPVGTKEIFYVSTDLSALITIYFDGVLVLSTTGTSARYPETGDGIEGSLGTHIIEAVAMNACGSNSVTCTWIVYEPLVITLTDPSSSLVLDLPDTQRLFTASVNLPATISFYLDGSQTPALQSSPNVRQASFEGNAPPHTIQVVASNASDSAQNCWNWLVIYPIPPVTLIGTVVSSDGCHTANDNVVLIINSVHVQNYSNGTYAIQMDYNIGAGGKFSEDHWGIGGSLSLSVTISWPEISDPNNPPTNSISQTYSFGSVMQSGTIFLPVPYRSYYTVTCVVSGTISGMTYGENEEGVIVLPHKETVTCSAQCGFQIVMPV